tara:strand:- start:124 stop:717 length:594 start_codon:yes stop_codon:yes gene_type:complete
MNKPTGKNDNQGKVEQNNDKQGLKKNTKNLKPEQSEDNLNEKIIADLKIKLKQTEDKLLRELAENDNLRKRHEKESQENLKYAIRNFSADLLSVTDNFERALNSISKDDIDRNPNLKNLLVGLEAVEKEIFEIFEKNGVKKFDSHEKKFDPEIHQAVSKIESTLAEGTIVEELAKGFMIGDRLLRPAMVVVSSGKNK